MYQLTSQELELCTKIADSAFVVHRELGPGLLEKIYEICFYHELNKRGVGNAGQVLLPVKYDGLLFDEALRMDVFVEQLIICELKAIDLVNPVWEAQMLSHLKLSGKNVGFLINFNVTKIKNGIRRYCLG